MIIIGIDWSTDDKKTGIALGSVQSNNVVIKEVKVGSKNERPEEMILRWLRKDQLALLAIDAPLGWPVTLAKELPSHTAGEIIRGDANDLFRRRTDWLVEREIGKRPLDVGADHIARTAHSALRLLDSLRKKTGLPIPLAWEMGNIKETCAIEVYPAATLRAWLGDVPNYKDKSAASERLKLTEKLSVSVSETSLTAIKQSSDAFDAVICVLAASDFLSGRCISMPTESEEITKKEGWIWVKNPDCTK